MLLVAAGGGGDAIAASALARVLGLAQPPAVMTYSWDRLIIDPLPGPRTVGDFDGLRHLAPDLHEVLPTTVPNPPAGSALPRLAAELTARLFLLDPTHGATGMARQIRAAATHLNANRLGLVDVGGDILARGGEPTLRSPLADLLALAACTLTDLPSTVYVIGPGIDGELDQTTVLSRLEELGAHRLGVLDADAFRDIRHVFTWHPSEATGLLSIAADGERGSVEVRDAANHIDLTDDTAAVYAVDARHVVDRSSALQLQATTSLDDAARLTAELTGVSELDYETTKAAAMHARTSNPPALPDLVAIDQLASAIATRGATYVSVRRLAELLGITDAKGFAAFQAQLASERPANLRPPLFRVCQ